VSADERLATLDFERLLAEKRNALLAYIDRRRGTTLRSKIEL
jgi:hypothetical protein